MEDAQSQCLSLLLDEGEDRHGDATLGDEL
jgi:hypothetical protein